MAHNTRVFDPPVVFAQTIGPAELNALDVLVSESVNGDMGGVWAPVTPIIIGGAGVQVTGPFKGGFRTLSTVLTPVSYGGLALETFVVAAFTPSALVVLDIPAVSVTNTVDVSLTLDIAYGAPNLVLKLVSIQDFGGANVTTNIDGARHNTLAVAGRHQISLQGVTTVTNAGTMRVRLEVLSAASGVENYGTGCLLARVTP